MPSVRGMKRTRVFGVVKGGDVARVLRSGRRLYPESSEGKFKNHVSVKGKENGWTQNGKAKKQEVCNSKTEVPKKVGSDKKENVSEVKRFGVVYTRKRRRLDVKKEIKAYETRSLRRLRSHSKKEDSSEVVIESKQEQSVVPVSLESKNLTAAVVSETVSIETDRNKGKEIVCCLSARNGKSPRLVSRNIQYRSGLYSRGIRKQRRSLRRRKARSPILFEMHNKDTGGLVPDVIDDFINSPSLSSPVSENKLSSSLQSVSAESPKKATSNVVGEEQSVEPSICFTNLLVIESDRCYRVVDARVELEISDSGEWVIAVKKDGSTRCTHLAHKFMRPCSSNRVTHDIIWTANEKWKLEFPNKLDWFIFKDLYKECSNRNVPSSPSKSIPVPGVREVLEFEDETSALFTRPDQYITMDKDEVARAMTRKTANYDLDLEDEEWLKKFNDESCTENKQHDPLLEDNFELMFDVFEKAVYYTPDHFTDKQAAANLCTELGKREVVEAVYGYWTEKRKRKRSALLRIFQGHQVKKAPLIPKPPLRKRRSFKRQPSQIGRGKRPIFLQGMVAKQCALEDHHMRRIEEAKLSVKMAVEAAILKRRRAQVLMENADLLIYKAAMALKIAEAAHVAESAGVAVDHLLD